jgi:hypothetical protein
MNAEQIAKGTMSKSFKIFAVYNELRDNGVPKQMAKKFARRLVENPELMKQIEAERAGL